VKARQHKNIVEKIKTTSRTRINSFEEIKKASSSHFGKLYSQEGANNKEQSLQFIEHIPQLIKEEDNQELNKLVTEAEFKVVIHQFDPDKALMSDDFTLHFYRKCW
jgi:hypothetical protein